MAALGMNHFTVLTDDLLATVAFYGEVLGLSPGPRPAFSFPGAWLYTAGGVDPILHIVAGRSRAELVKGVIDHIAFTGQGLGEVIAKLKAREIAHELRRLPGYGSWQLFFHDPNGAKVEVDFDAGERAG